MRVLLTHSYFLRLDPKQVAHGQPYPPLATLIAAALLRENGFEVRVFDPMFSRHADEVLDIIREFDPEIFVCYDDGFNYLTKMCLTNMREAAFRMMQHARDHGCKVIVSSSDATDHSEKYLDRSADLVIAGEAEHTLLEISRAIAAHQPLDGIRGVILKNDGLVQKAMPRAVSKALDEFPLPAWELIDLEPYRRMWLAKHGYFSMNVATTRGCPYKCNWCAKPIYGNSYNMRSAARVVEELSILKERYHIDHVWFCDDIFGLKRSWVDEFARLVNERGIKLRYKIQSRADLLVQERYVESLAASGCHEVWMGAESGSQAVLDAMDKGTTVEEIRQARALLKKHGIRAAYFLQFGYPGETREDINKTIGLVAETLPDDIGISVSYPLPGTVFYERVKQQLGEKQNWSDSDELALMFRNTYPPEFYRTLHRFVHSVYRRTRAERNLREQPFALSGLRSAASMLRYSITGALQNKRLTALSHGSY